MRLLRVVALAALVSAGGCGESIMPSPVAADRAALFDDLWRQFDLHYSFFELKDVDWKAVGAQYRSQALATKTDVEFGAVLARMLEELRDPHVSITLAEAGPTFRYRSRFEIQPTYFDAQLAFRRYVPVSQTSAAGHLRYGMADPTVGYIRVRDFLVGGWEGDFDVAIKSLAGASSLIVDVRGNPGGKHALAASLAGRFADRTRTSGYQRRRNGPAHADFTDYVAETVEPTGSARFTGPVYLLTDRGSFSTAEDFTLAMRSLPTVTVVGDTTAGAAGGPIVRELANGWTYQLSEWIAYTPLREAFEDIGLAPDVVVKSSGPDAAQGIDRVIERALELARSRTPE